MISDDVTKSVAEEYLKNLQAEQLLESLLRKKLTEEQLRKLISLVESNTKLDESIRKKVLAGLMAAAMTVSPLMGNKTTTTPGTPGTPATTRMVQKDKGPAPEAPMVGVTTRGGEAKTVRADDPRIQFAQKGQSTSRSGRDFLDVQPDSITGGAVTKYHAAKAEHDKPEFKSVTVPGTPGTPAKTTTTPTLHLGPNRSGAPTQTGAKDTRPDVGQYPPKGGRKTSIKPKLRTISSNAPVSGGKEGSGTRPSTGSGTRDWTTGLPKPVVTSSGNGQPKRTPRETQVGSPDGTNVLPFRFNRRGARGRRTQVVVGEAIKAFRDYETHGRERVLQAADIEGRKLMKTGNPQDWVQGQATRERALAILNRGAKPTPENKETANTWRKLHRFWKK